MIPIEMAAAPDKMAAAPDKMAAAPDKMASAPDKMASDELVPAEMGPRRAPDKVPIEKASE